MKPFLVLREAVHPLFQQSGLGMHPCLLPMRTLALTLEPWVSQTKITAAILCRQVKAAEVAACHTNSRSQDHEKEGYDRVLM